LWFIVMELVFLKKNYSCALNVLFYWMEKGLMAKRLLIYRMALQRTPTTNHSSNEHAPDLLRIPWKLTLLYRANWITENCKRENTGKKPDKPWPQLKMQFQTSKWKLRPLWQSERKHFHFKRLELEPHWGHTHSRQGPQTTRRPAERWAE